MDISIIVKAYGVGMGVWLMTYGVNRIWLMFKSFLG